MTSFDDAKRAQFVAVFARVLGLPAQNVDIIQAVPHVLGFEYDYLTRSYHKPNAKLKVTNRTSHHTPHFGPSNQRRRLTPKLGHSGFQAQKTAVEVHSVSHQKKRIDPFKTMPHLCSNCPGDVYGECRNPVDRRCFIRVFHQCPHHTVLCPKATDFPTPAPTHLTIAPTAMPTVDVPDYNCILLMVEVLTTGSVLEKKTEEAIFSSNMAAELSSTLMQSGFAVQSLQIIKRPPAPKQATVAKNEFTTTDLLLAVMGITFLVALVAPEVVQKYKREMQKREEAREKSEAKGKGDDFMDVYNGYHMDDAES
jgi:hypothetical protein